VRRRSARRSWSRSAAHGDRLRRRARDARRRDGRDERATSRRCVAGEPAFDEAMIGFGRWVADYYQAPLGEVLRAALPQGEQASARRARSA
jgi:primosomal protein N'